MYNLTIFLDTCALLYIAHGTDKLSSHAKAMIDSALMVFVSPISAWEISLKHMRGGLRLPDEPEKWFFRAVEYHNLEVCPLSAAICIAATRLPDHHRDPADRFIIASALSEKATVVTTDKKFQEYDIHVIN